MLDYRFFSGRTKKVSARAILRWVAILLLACTSPVFADNAGQSGKVIAGWVERIMLKDQPFVIKAKLDTGAKTSSFHAEDIKQFDRDGEAWVSFTLIFKDDDGELVKLPMERPRLRKVLVKEHDGNHSSRAVVGLDICFDGRIRNAEFNLIDRSEFIYPVLLGRRFLADVAIIDPAEIYLTQTTCQ